MLSIIRRYFTPPSCLLQEGTTFEREATLDCSAVLSQHRNDGRRAPTLRSSRTSICASPKSRRESLMMPSQWRYCRRRSLDITATHVHDAQSHCSQKLCTASYPVFARREGGQYPLRLRNTGSQQQWERSGQGKAQIQQILETIKARAGNDRVDERDHIEPDLSVGYDRRPHPPRA
jgi:hypothetical protein